MNFCVSFQFFLKKTLYLLLFFSDRFGNLRSSVINFYMSFGVLALHAAAASGNMNCVKLLLGVSVDKIQYI